MKILICTYTLSDGGAERVVSQWANGFFQRGEHVQIALLRESTETFSYSVDSRINIEDVSSSCRNRILNMMQASIRLRKFVTKNHFDIIISVLCPVHVFFATVFINCIKINTEHNAFERPKGISWKKDYLLKYYFNKLFDVVTVLTKRDLFLTNGRLKNVYHLPNPLAVTPYYSYNREKVILAVGRLDAWYYKGFDILIKSWSLIREYHSEWKLCIIGGGTSKSREFLNGLASDCGCGDSVCIMDYKQDIVEYYKKAELFVLSSRYEGFGLVLIEAMSQGCACVACDYVGRQMEIFGDNSCGLISPPNDIDSLANAMIQLLSNPEKRKCCSRNAYARSREFALENIMNIWYDIIANVRSE